MATVGAHTPADHSNAESNNTRVRFDGQIELTSRNGFSNPDLKDFDINGDPENIEMGAPADPVGWGVLIDKLDDSGIPTQQNTGPLPMEQDFYYQKTPLIDGGPPADFKNRARIAPPREPKVKVEGKEGSDLAGGWRGITYGWIAPKGRNGRDNVGASPYMTDEAPRVYVNATRGAKITVNVPSSEAPEGVVGLYIAVTAAHSTENQAATAPAWIQRKFTLARGTPTTYVIDGQIRFNDRTPGTNRTFQGEAGKYGVHSRRVKVKRRVNGFTTRLSFRYMTEMGWSQPQKTTNDKGTHAYVGTRRGWGWRPNRLPSNATMWQPLYQHNNSKIWYAFPPRAVGSGLQEIYATDPEKYPEGRRPQAFVRNRAEIEDDATGIPAPESPLEEPVVETTWTPLPAGNYRVRTIFYDEDGKPTAPSQPYQNENTGKLYVQVANGEYIQVQRPPVGNLIPNADGAGMNDQGVPYGWEFTEQTGVTITRKTNDIQIQTFNTGDTSGTARVVATTPLFDLPNPDQLADNPRAIRAVIHMQNRIAGSVGIRVQVQTNNGTWANSAETFRAADGRHVVHFPFITGGGATGNQVNIPGDNARARVQYLVRGSDPGGHNFTANIRHLGAMANRIVPRAYKRYAPVGDPTKLEPLEEDENEAPFEYPRHGMARVGKIRNDELPTTNLNGVNCFHYHATYGTPPSADYGIWGYATPWPENQLTTASLYASWEGVSKPQLDCCSIASFDAQGRMLENHGPIFTTNVSGEQPNLARKNTQFTTPPGTAFVKIYRGGFADGNWRVCGFQLDKGGISPYTNGNAASGWRRYTLDTGLDIPADSHLAFLGEVKSWQSAGAVFTDNPDGDGEPVTTVTVEARTTNSVDAQGRPTFGATWYPCNNEAEFNAIPKRRYWQLQVNLSRAGTDDTVSPLVSSVGVEILRHGARLLRSDGREYPLPVQVVNMPVPRRSRVRNAFISDNNTPRFGLRGRELLEVSGVELEAYSDPSAMRVGYDANHGDGLFEIEDTYANRSFFIWMKEPPEWEVDREIHRDEDPYYIHKASIDAYIISRESLTGEPIFND